MSLAKVLLAKVAIIAALLFGKKRPPIRAALLAAPRPGWWWSAGQATPIWTAGPRPRPGREAGGGHGTPDQAA